jgi:hypothetical protein
MSAESFSGALKLRDTGKGDGGLKLNPFSERNSIYKNERECIRR